MTDENLRQLRVLHIVSSGGVASVLTQSLFMPLLTRMPKARVKAQVVCLSPGAAPADVLRLNGVPVHDVALSRQRFSLRGFRDVLQAARQFRPDVIQAWGHTAQIASAVVRQRCDWKPKLVWTVANTMPLARDAGFIDRQKLKFAAKYSAKADRIVYGSEAAASQYRRSGFPDGGHLAISPGVDAARFKSDAAARRKVREQLEIPAESFVIGMVAPFQPEYDHATLFKAVGDLIKTNPDLSIVLAGHGVQKGNAPLMALVGGGALGARTHLLGEWSDVASLFNACDVVCSSALTDASRMTLVMAMLCGAPCVATGMGAQGEVLGQHGVAIEPGSPAAFVKGITRIMQLPPEKRAHMIQGARKHALRDFVYVRSLQKYLQLYCDLIGREFLASEGEATPANDASAAASQPQKAAAVKHPAPIEETTVIPNEDASPLGAATATPAEAAPATLEMSGSDSSETAAVRAPEQPAPVHTHRAAAISAPETQQEPVSCEATDIFKAFDFNAVGAPTDSLSSEGVEADAEFEDLLAPEDLESRAPVIPRTPTPQSKSAGSAAAPEAAKPDSTDRMRAAAREELKRAAAAMSAPVKKAPSAAPSAQPTECQLELLPDSRSG